MKEAIQDLPSRREQEDSDLHPRRRMGELHLERMKLTEDKKTVVLTREPVCVIIATAAFLVIPSQFMLSMNTHILLMQGQGFVGWQRLNNKPTVQGCNYGSSKLAGGDLRTTAV